MKRFLSTTKGSLISFVVINLILILLSLIGLFFGIWEITSTISISAFFNFFVLLIMLKTELKQGENEKFKAGLFVLYSVIRFILMALAVSIGIVVLLLTKQEGESKFRFLYSLSALLPLGTTMILFYLKGTFEYE